MTQAQLDAFLLETATLWAVSSRDERGGASLASPVTIKVRWEDVQQRFVTDAGEEATSRSRVFVDQAVAPGAWLYRGTSTEADPRDVADASLVRSYRQTPHLKDPTVVLREALL